jgi:Tfp pilus assembly protein PilE
MKNLFIKKNKNNETSKQVLNSKRGFTLLFAVLVSTLVVSIGATIMSIALRQTILSGTTRESQYAFYAANTVLECAHYWDTTTRTDLNGKTVFPVGGVNGVTEVDILEAEKVTCAGVNIITGNQNDDKAWEDLVINGDTTERTFYLKIKDRAGIQNLSPYEYCAQATVYKVDDGSTITTTIEAKGYNTCDTTNPRRVERGLVEQYQS